MIALNALCTRSPTLEDAYRRAGSGAHLCRDEGANLVAVAEGDFIFALMRELPRANAAAEEYDRANEQLYGVFDN
jgi:hypothetical protein